MPGYAIGIDLGGTHARAAVIDATGRVRAACKKAHDQRSPVEIAGVLAQATARAVADAGLAPEEIAAAGVGIAGQIHSGSGVVTNGPNLGWREVPFGALLSARVAWPVLLMNDLSAAAWGEWRAGAGEGQDDIFVFFVGSGVGSALILGGRLYEGASGVAGEVGHVKVVLGGRRCGCGELGCLEAYCGGANLAARAAEALAAGRTSVLAGTARTAADIERAALSGDELAREFWDDCARWLPMTLANCITLVNPARVILGGGVLATAPALRAVVRERAFALASTSARTGLCIVDARLGDDAGVVGAGLRALAGTTSRRTD